VRTPVAAGRPRAGAAAASATDGWALCQLLGEALRPTAWLLSKGDDIVPIPGTKRTARVEENCAADGIELSPEQIRKLDNLTPAAVGHHNEEQMRLLER